ncbi:MAG: tyrosine-type recombinase/integrase [Gallionella sp.]|nr:tyrosine-type recombinase/integrase [Gallionella sp.]
MGKLNDKLIQATKPSDKQIKLSDGDGLALVVKPSGTKLWWLRYRVDGKEKTFSIGRYPVISLATARVKAFELRQQLANDIDPMADKRQKAQERTRNAAPLDTVESVSREWFEKFGSQWVESHASKISRRLERDLYPHLGTTGIAAVTPVALLMVLRKVEARGALETAHRLHQNCGQIWRYAIATGRAERDITADLRGALPPARETHLGAITDPKEIGALLRNIDDYKGSEVVRLALKLAPLLFVRPGELRQAKWEEFDLPNSLWTIPAGRMKAKRPHVVPLSTHATSLLEELRTLHQSDFLFPSPRALTRCLSDVALLAALRRMGYTKEEMTAHGFRALASTNLEQLGYDVRLIELQLAHADQDQVRAAYKRETHLLRLDERRKMMQHWSDYLDQLKSGAQVIPLRA